jgi:hypothetical protein
LDAAPIVDREDYRYVLAVAGDDLWAVFGGLADKFDEAGLRVGLARLPWLGASALMVWLARWLVN